MSVGIVLPVFNAKLEHLIEAIDSTLHNQIYDQNEISLQLWVVDDGSTDKELIEYLDKASLSSNVNLITHPTNLGLAAALNSGIEVCKSH